MDYRIWAILGIILVIAELHTLTFVLVFIGAAALVTAISTGIGLTPGPESQFAIFSGPVACLYRSASKQDKAKTGRRQDFT